MSKEELVASLVMLHLSAKEFSIVLGVSRQAVDFWVTGQRKIPEHVARLVRLFILEPDLIDAFASQTTKS